MGRCEVGEARPQQPATSRRREDCLDRVYEPQVGLKLPFVDLLL
jgi:hypothetical protein